MLSNNKNPPQSQNDSLNFGFISDLGHYDICSDTVGEDVLECAAAEDIDECMGFQFSPNICSDNVAEDVSQSSLFYFSPISDMPKLPSRPDVCQLLKVITKHFYM